MMKVRLQWVFVCLGLSVVAILFCFHLYYERQEVTSWLGGVDVALRKLHSVSRPNMISSSRHSSSVTGTTAAEMTVEREGEEEGDHYEDQIWKESSEAQAHLSKTGFVNRTDQLPLSSSFSLPTPEATLPLSQLLQCEWLEDLHHYLASLPTDSRLVSIVSSDYTYREVLLNWLLTAQVKITHPLSNVLVLSLDASLHRLLTERGIACVHIPVSCLLKSSLKLTQHIAFTQVHIMRVLVMRLLNHWGYDVANYDSDALILRNPEPRYRQLASHHLIGSAGHFPFKMDKRWGTAVCIGVVMIRASPQTELYWESMSRVLPKTIDDQMRLNWALDAMAMRWDNAHCNTAVCTLTGTGRQGFRAAVLPVRDVCRLTCSIKKIRGYYIWHKGGARNRDGKKLHANQGGLWYLHDDWEHITHRPVNTGVNWLREIARE